MIQDKMEEFYAVLAFTVNNFQLDDGLKSPEVVERFRTLIRNLAECVKNSEFFTCFKHIQFGDGPVRIADKKTRFNVSSEKKKWLDRWVGRKYAGINQSGQKRVELHQSSEFA